MITSNNHRNKISSSWSWSSPSRSSSFLLLSSSSSSPPSSSSCLKKDDTTTTMTTTSTIGNSTSNHINNNNNSINIKNRGGGIVVGNNGGGGFDEKKRIVKKTPNSPSSPSPGAACASNGGGTTTITTTTLLVLIGLLLIALIQSAIMIATTTAVTVTTSPAEGGGGERGAGSSSSSFPMSPTDTIRSRLQAFQFSSQEGETRSRRRTRTRRRSTTSTRSGPERIRHVDGKEADGTFNGAPIYLERNVPITTTSIHCVGDDYQPTTRWKQRSCHFQNMMCFNTTLQEFVIFESSKERRLSRLLKQREHIHVNDVIRIRNDQAKKESNGDAGAAPDDNNNNNDDDITNSQNNTLSTQSISLGGINLKWGKGIKRVRWFPNVITINDDDDDGAAKNTNTITYYALPDHTVIIPYHSMNGANPGHLVWDDFMPMYNLLDMFQLLNKEDDLDDDDEDGSPPDEHKDEEYNDDGYRYDILPIRYVLHNAPRGLWASCDLRDEKTEICEHMIKKFFPLMNGIHHPYQLLPTNKFQLNITTGAETEAGVGAGAGAGAGAGPSAGAGAGAASKPETDLICAKNGVAGIGSLTDHGISKMHGWESEDYVFTHNHGRGGMIRNFRDYMMLNMELPIRPNLSKQMKHKIIFSEKSSHIPTRNIDFDKQVELLRQHIQDVDIQEYTFKELSLKEQLNVVHDASIYITVCGGGAVTAMFMPPGSTVIIYYSENGGAKNNKMTFEPALLDWDLFNAMTHIRIHWLPRTTMNQPIDQQALIMLIQHELDIISKLGGSEQSPTTKKNNNQKRPTTTTVTSSSSSSATE